MGIGYRCKLKDIYEASEVHRLKKVDNKDYDRWNSRKGFHYEAFCAEVLSMGGIFKSRANDTGGRTLLSYLLAKTE